MIGALLALTIAAAPLAHVQMTRPLPDFSIERDQQQLHSEQQEERARQEDLGRQEQTRRLYDDQRERLDHDGAQETGLTNMLGRGAGGFGAALDGGD